MLESTPPPQSSKRAAATGPACSSSASSSVAAFSSVFEEYGIGVLGDGQIDRFRKFPQIHIDVHGSRFKAAVGSHAADHDSHGKQPDAAVPLQQRMPAGCEGKEPKCKAGADQLSVPFAHEACEDGVGHGVGAFQPTRLAKRKGHGVPCAVDEGSTGLLPPKRIFLRTGILNAASIVAPLLHSDSILQRDCVAHARGRDGPGILWEAKQAEHCRGKAKNGQDVPFGPRGSWRNQELVSQIPPHAVGSLRIPYNGPEPQLRSQAGRHGHGINLHRIEKLSSASHANASFLRSGGWPCPRHALAQRWLPVQAPRQGGKANLRISHGADDKQWIKDACTFSTLAARRIAETEEQATCMYMMLADMNRIGQD